MVLKRSRKMFKKRRVMRAKKYAKRSYTTKISNSVSRPQKTILKLPYFTSGQLNSALGAFVQQTFNLNSLFDPDRTGIGHQPLGFDEWKPFYNRYRVFKVDYVITLTNLDPDQAANVAVINQNAVTTWVDDSVFEQPNSFYSCLAPRDGSASRKVIKGSVYLPRLNGQSSTQYKANENSQAITTVSPVEILTQSIVTHPTLAGSEVNIGYAIKYIYHTELFDPNVLTIS